MIGRRAGKAREIALECELLRTATRQSRDAQIAAPQKMVSRHFHVIRIAHDGYDGVEILEPAPESGEPSGRLVEMLMTRTLRDRHPAKDR